MACPDLRLLLACSLRAVTVLKQQIQTHLYRNSIEYNGCISMKHERQTSARSVTTKSTRRCKTPTGKGLLTPGAQTSTLSHHTTYFNVHIIESIRESWRRHGDACCKLKKYSTETVNDSKPAAHTAHKHAPVAVKPCSHHIMLLLHAEQYLRESPSNDCEMGMATLTSAHNLLLSAHRC